MRSLIKPRFKIHFDLGCFLFSAICAVLISFSGIVYIGSARFELSADRVLDWVYGPNLALVILIALLLFVVLYFVSLFAFTYFEDSRKGSHYSSQLASSVPTEALTTNQNSAFLFVFLKYFLIIMMCWLVWIIPHFPGSFDQDTIWQTLIWRNQNVWYDHHPWLTTWLFGCLLDLGTVLGSQAITLTIYSLLQTILTASCVALMLAYIRKFNPPQWLLISSLVLICIFPVFPSFASSMCKDSLFSIFWIPLMIIYIEGVRTRGNNLLNLRYFIPFLILVALAVLTRKTGIVILTISLMAMIFLANKQAKKYWCGALLFALSCLFLWSTFLLPSIGVDKGPTKELFSCPLQQSARCVLASDNDEISITEEEHNAINGVLPYERLSSLYELTSADPVKDNYKDPDTQSLIDYLQTWITMGFKYPLIYATATMGTNLPLFFPSSPFVLHESITQDWIDQNVRVFLQYTNEGYDNETNTSIYEQTREGLVANPSFELVRTIEHSYESLLNKTPLRVLNTPFFMVFFLPFFILCFGFSRFAKDQRAHFCVALLPSFLLFASIVVGPLVMTRYCVPSSDIFPLILFLPWILKNATPKTSKSIQ